MRPLVVRFDHLDLLRGVASLLVMAGHLRAYVLVSYEQLSQAAVPIGLPIKAFYLTTGLGHQAVLAFFALSGFLVGGRALDDIRSQRFLWSRYIARRLTRLWIVIVPALVLTLFLDVIGALLAGGAGYDGRYYDVYFSGPQRPVGADHSLLTLLGNLMFLQTIQVPTFGSNGPLWSLANEFWYYIVFPLAAWLVLGQMPATVRCVMLIVLIGLCVTLPTWLLEGGLIWVAGALAARCAQQPALAELLKSAVARVVALALLVGLPLASRTQLAGIGDIGIGLGFALTLPVVATLPSPAGTIGRLYATIARASSEISFTLYVTHFPMLTLIAYTWLAPTRLPPGPTATAIYLAMAAAAIGWAVLLWWCFEHRTDRVYAAIARRLPVRAKSKGDDSDITSVSVRCAG